MKHQFADKALFDLALDDGKPVRTKDGYLKAFARIARTGIQTYKGHELGRPEMDEVRVYRPETEVFSVDAMKSMANKPLTLHHPRENVAATNWRHYTVGHTGEDVVRDGEHVRVPLMLCDGAAINAAMHDGVKQLSVGYSADINWAEGTTPDGEPYHATQSGIDANHVAIVPNARGGEQLRLGDDDRASMTCWSCDQRIPVGTRCCPYCQEEQDKQSNDIRTEADLQNAIKAMVRGKNFSSEKMRIYKAAKKLGKVEDLPEDWNVGDAMIADANYFDKEFSTKRRKVLAKQGKAMCLAGETRIVTLDGELPIVSLVGQHVELLTRDKQGAARWVRSEVRAFGHDRLYRVALRSNRGNRAVVLATAQHRWYVGDNETVMLTRDLEKGYRLTPVGRDYAKEEIAALCRIRGAEDASVHELPTGMAARSSAFCLEKESTNLSPRLPKMHGAENARIQQDGRSAHSSAEEVSRQATAVRVDAGGVRGDCSVTGEQVCALSETGEEWQAVGGGSLPSYGAGSRAAVPSVQSFARVLGRQRRKSGAGDDVPIWTVTGVTASRRNEEVYCAIVPGTARFVIAGQILTGNSGGGYPIENKSDLEHAVQAFGRAGKPAATKAHIINRAKALGATGDLPEGWSDSRGEAKMNLVIGDQAFEVDEAVGLAFRQAIADARRDAKPKALEQEAGGGQTGDQEPMDQDPDDPDEAEETRRGKQTGEKKDRKDSRDARDGEIAVLKRKLADATAPGAIDKRVEDRQALLAVSLPLLDAGYEYRGKSDEQIMRDVVLRGDIVGADKMTAAEIGGAWRAMTSNSQQQTPLNRMVDGMSNQLRMSDRDAYSFATNGSRSGVYSPRNLSLNDAKAMRDQAYADKLRYQNTAWQGNRGYDAHGRNTNEYGR
jgi:hypothetical protein